MIRHNIDPLTVGVRFSGHISRSKPDSHDSRDIGIVKARVSHLQTSQGLLLIMSRIYVDNLDARLSEQELEDEFQTYRVIRRIWIAESHKAMHLSTLMTVEMFKTQFVTRMVNITGGLSFLITLWVVVTVVIMIVVLENLTVQRSSL